MPSRLYPDDLFNTRKYLFNFYQEAAKMRGVPLIESMKDPQSLFDNPLHLLSALMMSLLLPMKPLSNNLSVHEYTAKPVEES